MHSQSPTLKLKDFRTKLALELIENHFLGPNRKPVTRPNHGPAMGSPGTVPDRLTHPLRAPTNSIACHSPNLTLISPPQGTQLSRQPHWGRFPSSPPTGYQPLGWNCWQLLRKSNPRPPCLPSSTPLAPTSREQPSPRPLRQTSYHSSLLRWARSAIDNAIDNNSKRYYYMLFLLIADDAIDNNNKRYYYMLFL